MLIIRMTNMISRAIQMFKIYFIFYLFLNIVIVALERGQNDRHQVTKSEQLLNKPVYMFVKTDKHANIKWGVRHYVPHTLKQTGFKN